MHPTQTIFRLARAGGEFNKLYAMAKRHGEKLPAGTLNFPTVVAERDGKVVGFLATAPVKKEVWAGPLILDQPPNAWLALRLGEAYEVVLKYAGIKEYFHLVEKNREDYVKMLQRLTYQIHGETETHFVMRREIS